MVLGVYSTVLLLLLFACQWRCGSRFVVSWNRAAIGGSGVAAGPSPGDYNMPTMAAEIMKRVEAHHSAGVFGASTKRFYGGIMAEGTDEAPGPGQYDAVRVFLACLPSI